jgi:lysophospholipase L1-like esterase
MKKLLFVFFVIVLASCSMQQPAGIQSPQRQTVFIPLKQSLPESFIPTDYSIVAFGDSLTRGLGDTTNNGGYVPLLEKMLLENKGIKNINMNNLGINGNTTWHLLERMELSEVRSSITDADIVIITVGGNDLMKVAMENFLALDFDVFRNEQKEYEERLKKIIEEIRMINDDIHIMLVGLYNPFDVLLGNLPEVESVIEEWNEGSQTLLKEYDKTTFVTISDIFKNSDVNLLYTDDFHPNSIGYERMAERIHQTFIQEISNK